MSYKDGYTELLISDYFIYLKENNKEHLFSNIRPGIKVVIENKENHKYSLHILVNKIGDLINMNFDKFIKLSDNEVQCPICLTKYIINDVNKTMISKATCSTCFNILTT